MSVRELWRAGSFVCTCRSVRDREFDAILCVKKDGEAVVEVPVLSTIEAEEHAHRLKVLVERHQGR